jgi:hypothetical protein
MKKLQTATIAMSATAMLIVAGLGASSFGPMATQALTDQIGEMAVAYNNARLERDFEKVYPQYRERLPIQIDDRTTLVDLSYRGHVFRLRHLVETDRARTAAIASSEQTRKATLGKVCADEDMRTTMKRGAIYEYQYLDRQSRLLSSFDIRNADCENDDTLASGPPRSVVR